MSKNYFTLENLNQLELKLEKYNHEKSEFEKKIEVESEKCTEVEQQLISIDGNIEKKLQKLKKNPKTTSQKCWNIFTYDQQPQYDLIHKFGRMYTDVYYQYLYEISKLDQKIEDTIKAIKETKMGLNNHFYLRDHLPEQFHVALNHINERIHDWFETDRNNQVEQLTNKLNHPLYNAIISDKWFYTKLCELHLQDLINDQMTDQQIIDGLKNNKISEYYDLEKTLTDKSMYYVNQINNQIKYQNSRNVDKEADQYFTEVKCVFIDQIVSFCWEINSVSNVTLGEDGSINGTIHATNGDFYIKTIGAGGYNIQCFHYRVIIKKIN